MRLWRWAVAGFPKDAEGNNSNSFNMSQVPDSSVSTLYLAPYLMITASLPGPSGVNRHMSREVEPTSLYFIQDCHS